MEAYLDNSATTKPFKNVIDTIVKVSESDYGNPSSMHLKGFEAEKYIISARENISKILKVDAKELYFTSGGTEANNLALIGAALANKRTGMHIITTCFEHASVYNPLIMLEEFGFKITYLSVDKLGHIDIEELKKSITDETIIVSIMMVNNEIGAVQDIETISKVIKEVNPKTLFHVDAIQAFGKYKIFPKRMGIDMLSISGHKIHGPKGSGVLYVRDKVKIKPILHGGGQEKNVRSGTENVAAIAGIGEAAREIYTDFDEHIESLYKLKENFIEKVLNIDGTVVNGVDFSGGDWKANLKETAPHIVSVSFKNCRSEVLLHSLEEKGVYVSSGSACSSNHPAVSGTLKAIGVAKDLLDCTLRFSFCVNTTEEEIEYAIACLEELVPVLSRYVRKK